MPGKVLSIDGQVFGRWKVLEFSECKNKKSYWLCECQCEKKTRRVVRGDHLRAFRSVSCGCGYSPVQAELTGQIFERWKVIELVGVNRYKTYVWLCECQCDNKTRELIYADYLVMGKSKSCGCIEKENLETKEKAKVLPLQ